MILRGGKKVDLLLGLSHLTVEPQLLQEDRQNWLIE